ncbi:uncharacterized protein SPAPADRAFT_139101 [Spathaspora passalidarum NRRL Y-27907]|uniref:WD repeat-containing protein JIP5 n=1 Tax=Spathaspora passalidarum (strain NRRL Y-27907 / 11-Y1) TaxID=619300 RepID=G3APU6_SPAPN|nr:uncharacterized protein SPAPADRAFT_139101 [Spathaspora passalidarum NRRL Y-27907]EGW32267.1 hypothetical protein SPAPADRAFT_139101 [Spathaspora passalidarum NRRL Y-27907]
MAKKKSNAANAAQVLESSVSPIVEINYKDPLFTIASHPTKPILLSGLATGHVYCNSYDAEQLEERSIKKREEILELQKQAYEAGKLPYINKSVSQSGKKWWKVIQDHSEVEDDLVRTNWKTKRHKGSCRHAIFDPLENSVGEFVYTVGTDNIIKKAATETGKVVGKHTVTGDYPNPKDSITKLCHSTSNPVLLAGTENGHVLVYDSSNLTSGKLKFKVSSVHDDAINHIMAMPTVSAYHYLTLGSTTLAHIDIRKGIITQSDDQEDELLSMCYASDNITENNNDTVLVGHGEGIVTIWKNSKNKFMDQLSRIKVNKEASIDAIVPTMNADDEEMCNSVWYGDSEGLLHRVNYKRGKVAETRVHSSARGKHGAVDEVGILDIDYDYRLISAGMDTLKIWSNREVEQAEHESEEEEEDSDSSDSDVDKESESDSLGPSDFSDSDDDNDSEKDKDNDEQDDSDEEDADSDSNSDEEEEAPPPQLVRRKRTDISQIVSKPKRKVIDINKLTKTEPEEPAEEPKSKKQKLKEKKMTTKQLRNMQKHEHGIRKFEGL